MSAQQAATVRSMREAGASFEEIAGVIPDRTPKSLKKWCNTNKVYLNEVARRLSDLDAGRKATQARMANAETRGTTPVFNRKRGNEVGPTTRRKCIACPEMIDSTGPGHRMCWTCGHRDVSPYAL